MWLHEKFLELLWLITKGTAERKGINFGIDLQELTAAKDELERQVMASRQREAEALNEVSQLNEKLMLEHDKFMKQAADIQRLHEEIQRLREQVN